jgi:tRNA A-37 threonylcarbamoyl transferase component Bud32
LVVASSKKRKVYRFVFGRGEEVYLKRYHMSGIKSSLRTVIKMNKAQKAWRIGRNMRCRGVATPLPIAFLKKRLSPLSADYVCVTKGLPDAVDLFEAVKKTQGIHQQKRRRRLIAAVAEFLASLHNHKIYHGDFSADNILVRKYADAKKIRIYIIDLDAVRTTGFISRRRRIKNLEELGRNFLNFQVVSLIDRIRFLNIYLAHYNGGKDTLKTLFRKVQLRTEKRLRRYKQSFVL